MTISNNTYYDAHWFTDDGNVLLWNPPDDESEREDWFDVVRRQAPDFEFMALYDQWGDMFGPLGNGWMLLDFSSESEGHFWHSEWSEVCQRNGWNPYFSQRGPNQTYISQPSFNEHYGRMLPNLAQNLMGGLLLVYDCSHSDDGTCIEFGNGSAMFYADKHHVNAAILRGSAVKFQRILFVDGNTHKALAESGLSGKVPYIATVANYRLSSTPVLHILDTSANVPPDQFITHNLLSPAYYIGVPFMQCVDAVSDIDAERQAYLADMPESD